MSLSEAESLASEAWGQLSAFNGLLDSAKDDLTTAAYAELLAAVAASVQEEIRSTYGVLCAGSAAWEKAAEEGARVDKLGQLSDIADALSSLELTGFLQ